MKVDSNQIMYVIWLSVVASLGGFLFGYDTAVISGTVDQVKTQFRLDDMMTGWYVGCALAGSIAGISIPRFRGRLVSMYQLAITVGFLGAYLANYGLLNYSETLIAKGATEGLFNKIFATEAWRGMPGMESLPVQFQSVP
jgi:hypothetical protein